VNHQLQQLFDFCLEPKGFFFGYSHLISSFVSGVGQTGSILGYRKGFQELFLPGRTTRWL
jgi:hypothetical protein